MPVATGVLELVQAGQGREGGWLGHESRTSPPGSLLELRPPAGGAIDQIPGKTAGPC